MSRRDSGRPLTVRRPPSLGCCQQGVQMNAVESGTWSPNWIWGLPLIVLNVVIHVIGLGLINERVAGVLGGTRERRRVVGLLAAPMALMAAPSKNRFERSNVRD